MNKKKEIQKQILNSRRILAQLEDDISVINQGKSIMAYMENYPAEHAGCFRKLFKRIAVDKLTMTGAPFEVYVTDLSQVKNEKEKSIALVDYFNY